eukprot:3754325-Amphidinium_carterae.1
MPATGTQVLLTCWKVTHASHVNAPMREQCPFADGYERFDPTSVPLLFSGLCQWNEVDRELQRTRDVTSCASVKFQLVQVHWRRQDGVVDKWHAYIRRISQHRGWQHPPCATKMMWCEDCTLVGRQMTG